MRILSTLVLVVAALALPVTAPATAAEPVCSELVSSAPCDSDRDGFSDSLEKKVCGTATCATGREDEDSDGIPDTSEFIVCGEATCAEPEIDTDKDGIPDFAEIYVCGEASCSTGREDSDGEGIGDWVEFVICGNRACANGTEDFDADGVSDAWQLAACVVKYDITTAGRIVVDEDSDGEVITVREVTERDVLQWWPLIPAIGLFAIGLGFFIAAMRRRQAEDEPIEDSTELLGLNQ
ncbi:hypothetical protein M2152_001756 [Microbacteriaceae bacterium SG_E_30_P1]|uniref:Thrombospondin type 3 repeat-containing protein n=1 Tax=Antiquaquibacter oligotrophicus TaxID=2880260 RepID=A0ABT6KNJ3_9MICO|nr:hypothetical protein [Antiquaquibacter oligotrophicus]MDH6181574.1 hypothetical protein [Antiquaquibacter oligotrophicus]UDF12739.1 hypothetical protein LH407_11325 [Antiquaquibacter oligotrophicus]